MERERTLRRLHQIQKAFDATVSTSPTAASQSPSSVPLSPSALDVESLNKFLDKHDFDVRERTFKMFTDDPMFKDLNYNLSMEHQQDLCWQRLKRFTQYLKDSCDNDWQKRAATDCLYSYDLSMLVRWGANFGLFRGTIMNLGTEKHQNLVKLTEDFAISGSFALTELGHGSNVRGIETTAHYDQKTHEFIINTPTESAQKYWIGNATTCDWSVVFAQLIVGHENKGVHAFVAQVRDISGKPKANLSIGSVGHKMGLNGVNNGRFWFRNFRVPYDALLDRFSSIDEDGQYISAIANNDVRFSASIAELVSGRVNICTCSNRIAQLALATAIGYGEQRKQFGPPNEPEVPIMDYKLHQYRLIPYLAACYVFTGAIHKIIQMYMNRSEDDMVLRMRQMKDIHTICSGMKGVATWHTMGALQVSREACGGMGFKSDSRIGILKSEADAWLTFEGDNYVLMNQLSKQLAKEFAAGKTKGKFGPRLSHLNEALPPLPLEVTRGALRDLKLHLQIFQLREAYYLQRLHSQIKSLKEKGMKSWDIWNEVGPLSVNAGKAYTERFVLEEFMTDFGSFQQSSVHNTAEVLILPKLANLWALHKITNDNTFMTPSILNRSSVEVMEQEVLVLLDEIRPHCLQLVQAFGIPDALKGRIAVDYIGENSYEKSLNSHPYHGNIIF